MILVPLIRTKQLPSSSITSMIQEDYSERCSKTKLLGCLGLTPRSSDKCVVSKKEKTTPPIYPLQLTPVTPTRTRKSSVCTSLNSPLSPLAPLRQNSRNKELSESSSDEDDELSSCRMGAYKVDLTSPLGCKLRPTLAMPNTAHSIHSYEQYCVHCPSEEKLTGRSFRSVDNGEQQGYIPNPCLLLVLSMFVQLYINCTT